jgi:parvulin-like peptidyl-prolyl isomerase
VLQVSKGEDNLPKKTNKPQREPTRRQLSHWQKESRLQRIIILAGILVIVAVVVVVGTGIYANQYRPLQATVIKVGDTGYNMDYYINMLAYYGLTSGSQYIPYVTDLAVQKIQQMQLVRDAAAALNPPITVTDNEVNQALTQQGLSSNQTYKDIVRDQLLVDKLKSDYFDKLVPQSGEQRAVLAMFLESQGQLNDIQAMIQSGESFKDIAAKLSLETKSKSNDGDFGWVPRGVLPTTLGNASDTVLDDKVFNSETAVNQLVEVEDPNQVKNIGYWLLEVTETRQVTTTPTPTPTGTETQAPTPTPTTTTEVHLMAMLLSSKAQAEEIKTKLEAGGEGNDWSTLAKQYSSYTGAANNGGDLGFVSKDSLTLGDVVKNVIFPADPAQALPVNKISDPIADGGQTTNGGFWLIELTGIDPNKAIEGDNRTTLVSVQLNDWVQKLWNDNQGILANTLTDAQKQYAVNAAYSRLGG